MLDYLLHRDEEEKEFVTDINHEDIEHRRELKAHEKIQRTYEIEENIQENVIFHYFSSKISFFPSTKKVFSTV